MSIHIALCDDEKHEIIYIKRIVSNWAMREKKEVMISTFDSAEAFLFAYEADKSFDILLLDIQMKAMNGIDLAKHLRAFNQKAQIIFITGMPDFIAEGYEVSALHYLMKPVDDARLCSVLSKACDQLGKVEPTLLLDEGGVSTLIAQKDILFAEALMHMVNIQTTERVIDTKKTLTELEDMLESSAFVRCHRSYIVGLRHVKSITRTDVLLDHDKAIPLSRRLYHTVYQAFIGFYKGGK